MNQNEYIEYLKEVLIYPDEFKIDEFGYQEFYKDNKKYFEYNLKIDTLYCAYHIRNVFKHNYRLNTKQIDEILRDILSKYFKMYSTKVV